MTSESIIFVVDDDEAVRDSLKALLESAGLTAEVYASGRQFLNEFAALPSGCLLLDMRMPDIGGLELLQELAARDATLPVIIITAYGDVPLAVKAMRAGAVDFIEKPFTKEVILDSIHRALASCTQVRRTGLSNDDLAARTVRLTPREREVLERLVLGQLNKQIAHDLGISPRTVEIHRARVMEKMQARNLAQLVRMIMVT